MKLFELLLVMDDNEYITINYHNFPYERMTVEEFKDYCEINNLTQVIFLRRVEHVWRSTVTPSIVIRLNAE